MNQQLFEKLKQPYFLFGILGAVKLILDNFGVHIPNDTLNNFSNGVAAFVTIIGIIVDHGKQQPVLPSNEPQPKQPPAQP